MNNLIISDNLSNELNGMEQLSEINKDHLKDTVPELMCFVNNMPGIVYWKNKEGVYLWLNDVNEQDRLKYNLPLTMIGKTDYDLFPSYIANEYRRHDLETMLSENGTVREETGYSATGEEYAKLFYKRPLKDEQKNVIGIIGHIIDITNFKQLGVLSENHRKFNPDNLDILNKVDKNINEPLKEVLILINFMELHGDTIDNLSMLSQVKGLISILFDSCNNILRTDLKRKIL